MTCLGHEAILQNLRPQPFIPQLIELIVKEALDQHSSLLAILATRPVVLAIKELIDQGLKG